MVDQLTPKARAAVERLNGLWTSAQTAEYLGVPERTLDQWAYQSRGPAWAKIGRYRRYRPVDVDAYVDANRHGGTAA